MVSFYFEGRVTKCPSELVNVSVFLFLPLLFHRLIFGRITVVVLIFLEDCSGSKDYIGCGFREKTSMHILTL